MPSVDDVLTFQTALGPADKDWLRALVADWQLIADLAFSDLVLWVEDSEARGWWSAAQIRPTTGPTTLLEDVVGTFLPADRSPLLAAAFAGDETVDDPEADASGRTVLAVPVRRRGRTIGVVERRREAPGVRPAGALESAYLEVAGDLLEMIRRGELPGRARRPELVESLRVGDGFVRTDAAGIVRFASPNALSGYRRLGLVGDLVGSRLADVTAALLGRRAGNRTEPGMLAGLEDTEGELDNGTATLRLRMIPVRSGGRPAGSLLLLRDVTELRRRERELVSKDATIREIHHRVKNNLQTVAALLRLQGRRLESPEGRHALDEAVRRVGSIALVHETLSQSFDDVVDFDLIADRLLRTVPEVAGDRDVRVERIGSFGSLPGEVATALAMVLTELIQNAAEHAFDGDTGHLVVAVNRIRDRVRLRVSDDGRGLPPDFRAGSSLGLSIVSTLVETELSGTLAFQRRPGGGTTVSIGLVV